MSGAPNIHPRLRRYFSPESAPRCPQCGYSLFQLTELRCPECGLEVDEDDFAAGRWLADENRPNRRAMRRARVLFWMGVAAALIGTGLAVYRSPLWASASGLLVTVGFLWGLLFQWGRGAQAYPVVFIFGLIWLIAGIVIVVV